MIRAIRGATTADENTAESIRAATKELFLQVLQKNQLSEEDLISITFTMTQDLNAIYPAKVVREMGMCNTPLLCYQELAVENSLQSCIRVMVLAESEKSKEQIAHVYLKGARILRPDLVK